MEKWYPTFWLFLPEVSKIRRENIWKLLGESAFCWYQQQNLYWNICFIKRWVATRCTSHSWCWTSQNCCKLHLGESLQVHKITPACVYTRDLGLGIISTPDRRFSWALPFSRLTHQGEPRWTPQRFDPFWSAVAVPTIVRVAAEKHGGAWWMAETVDFSHYFGMLRGYRSEVVRLLCKCLVRPGRCSCGPMWICIFFTLIQTFEDILIQV